MFPVVKGKPQKLTKQISKMLEMTWNTQKCKSILVQWMGNGSRANAIIFGSYVANIFIQLMMGKG